MTPQQFNVFVKKQVEFGVLPKRLYAEGETFVRKLCEEREAFVNQIFAETYKEPKLYPYTEADYSVMALDIAEDLTLIRVDLPEKALAAPLCLSLIHIWESERFTRRGVLCVTLFLGHRIRWRRR